jgi:hypothetical protein
MTPEPLVEWRLFDSSGRPTSSRKRWHEHGKIEMTPWDFDPADYLKGDKAIAIYLAEAIETNDPAYVAPALDVAARAKGRRRNGSDSSRKRCVWAAQDRNMRALPDDARADRERTI